MSCPSPMWGRSCGASFARLGDCPLQMLSNSELPLPPGVCVLERGWLSSNSIVLTGAASAVVIDTGYWAHAEQTVALISNAIGELPLTGILNTHLHSDHCGGNAALQTRFPAARTQVPAGVMDAALRWDPAELTYQATGQHCPRFRVDGSLEPGQPIELGGRRWDVHAAPGHDPHSIVLFEPDTRTLISADALWENGFGVVFPELEGEQAFEEVAATLDMIERLEPLLVIPGHGRPFQDVGNALSKASSRLQAYIGAPQRHAAHAAKVLLKFKLLEAQQIGLADLLMWARRTHYFALVHQRWFADLIVEEWLSSLIAALVQGGAARLDGNVLNNN